MTAVPPGDDDGDREERVEDERLNGDVFDQAAFDAAFAAEFGQATEPDRPAAAPTERHDEIDHADGSAGTESTDQRRIIAVVLTPIRSAAALAALCAMASIDAHVIASRNGALAVRTITGPVDETELLLTGAPAEAVELAQTLSRTAKVGVVLLTANLGTGQDGPSGTITGREYTGGEAGQEVPAGLVLANADDVLESLLIGALDPLDAPGRIDPAKVARPGGLFGTRRRKKR
ncbi:hypothetical protein [Pseudactinotalea sp. Z1732]|uniref:hypothetical protein n=1 Tax=Micrococcales TaxID=85006 RepID=UPI003C7BAA01